MLEQQQAQLVAGMRELYRRLRTGEGWPGPWLEESISVDGNSGGKNKRNHPLTHDILKRLDLLYVRADENGSPTGSVTTFGALQHLKGFDEDCGRLQQRLIKQGAGLVTRRRKSQQSGSRDDGSDHGCAHHRRKRSRVVDVDTSSTASDAEHGNEQEDVSDDDNNIREDAQDLMDDEPTLSITQSLTPSSSSSSHDTPDLQQSQSLQPPQRQQNWQPCQKSPPLHFSDPFAISANSVSLTPPTIPSQYHGESVHAKSRHCSHPLSKTLSLMDNNTTQNPSPLRRSMHPNEFLRVSWAANSLAAAAAMRNGPSSSSTATLLSNSASASLATPASITATAPMTTSSTTSAAAASKGIVPPAMTLTPDIDVVDWSGDGEDGFEGLSSLTGLAPLDAVGDVDFGCFAAV